MLTVYYPFMSFVMNIFPYRFDNRRDVETDEGKFLHTIQYAIAGLERRKILRRTMNGRLSSLKNG
ncbi:hypothetical protein [Chryseobacterium sp.]|uniref:hypothetical protein n=1 Tax=Chryseobacterium sp. TaxID=1871047 RepID=UPI00289F1D7D|nr:hypothetical protein [Chryseobacterium sp.]